MALAAAMAFPPQKAVAFRGPLRFICSGGMNPPGIKVLPAAKRLGRRTGGEAQGREDRLALLGLHGLGGGDGLPAPKSRGFLGTPAFLSARAE